MNTASWFVVESRRARNCEFLARNEPVEEARMSDHTTRRSDPDHNIPPLDSHAIKRFFEKVNKTAGCWIWTASTVRAGYGQFGVLYGIGDTRIRLAHRVSWVIHNGQIPPGMYVLHKCDNPPCVNPEHLFLGTLADNNHDRDAKGRGGNHLLVGRNITSAVLSADDVRAIRRDAESGHSLASLARRYGVNPSTVSLLVARKRWKHVR